MSIRIVPCGTSLIEEITAELIPDRHDYSANLVVFPGKRPAHFLRKILAERMQRSIVPPCILSMDEFIDRLYETVHSDRKLETIDAIAVLYDIHRQSPNPLGKNEFLTPDSFFPLGLKIYNDLEELQIESITSHAFRGVEAFAAENIPVHSAKRLQSLSHFYDTFYSKVHGLCCSTRSLRYRTVSEEISEIMPDNSRKIIFSGFYAFTKSEKELCKKLAQREDTLFLFQHGTGLKDQISFLGSVRSNDSEEKEGPAVNFYASPDTHGQVFALNRVLNEAKTDLNEKTVIVLPSSESLFPLLRQSLSFFDEDAYNISVGYPLVRTPVFGFLNNLMELVSNMDGDRLYIPDYLKFVLHPYMKNIYCNGEAETTRIMFHAIEDKLVRNRTKTFATLAEIEETISSPGDLTGGRYREDLTDQKIINHLRKIHRHTIGKFLAFQNVKDFAAQCTNILFYIYKNSTARLHPLFYPFSESFIRALDTLKRSFMQDIIFSEKTGYFVFLRKYLMTCHTPFEGLPVRGLQVLGFLETRTLQFDKVFVLDANEEVLPDTRKEDSLLPLKAREILNLPTYRDRDALAAYYFENLFHGAKEIHLFFVESDKKEKSRFAEYLLWEKQKRDRERNGRKYLTTLQYSVSLGNSNPREIRKTDEIIRFLKQFTFNATTLDTYLRCQLAFYYSAVLNLTRKDDFSGDIERTDIGEFVHSVLSGYFQNKKGKPLDRNDINADDMDVHIDRLFTQKFGDNPSGATYLLKRQIRKHMRDLITKYYPSIMEQNSLIFLGIEEDLKIIKHAFRLRGRLDSIEQRGRKIVIVDYKTGSNPSYLKINFQKLDLVKRETWSEAIGSLQLPFYLLLYSDRTGREVDALDAMFLLLGRSTINRDIELPLFDTQEQKIFFPILENIIFRLLGEIVDPGKSFLPAADKKLSCPNCDYQYICGTQWIGKTKRN